MNPFLRFATPVRLAHSFSNAATARSIPLTRWKQSYVRHFRLEPPLVLAAGVEFLRRVKERALDTLRLDRRALGALVYRFPGLSLQPPGQVVDASGRLVGTRRELVELGSKSFIGALCGIDGFLPRVVESSFNFRELPVYRVSFASCTGAPRV